MEKPIIAISLAGILVKKDPWKRAHETGMKELAEKSGIPEVMKNSNSEDYFSYVERALEVIYPEISPEERIKKRRKDYFERVLRQIQDNPSKINTEEIEYLKKTTEDYSFVLITTGTKNFVEEVLDLIDARGIFDYLGVSTSEEKDDKIAVLSRTVQEFGKPDYFLGSARSKEFCISEGIGFVEVSDESTIEDLKKFFERLKK